MTTAGPQADDLVKAAAAYEEILVPALFTQWTDLVLDRAKADDARRVMDVACGTGVLARRAAARIRGAGRVSGVDLNPAMLSVAEQLAPEVEWRQADVRSLPFAENEFDVVVSQFGLMLFEERHAALQEMMRVLVPGGRLAVAVFDSLERIPAYAAMARVFERKAGEEFGHALRQPFTLGDVDELSSLFAASGITPFEISSHAGSATFGTVERMVLADVQGWFPVAGLTLDAATLQAVVVEADNAMSPFTLVDGEVRLDIGVHLVTAVKE